MNKPFTAAGTVFTKFDASLCDGVAQVTIRITDKDNTVATATTNEVGNFWITTPLSPPLTIQAERNGVVRAMPVTTPTGACALCHSLGDAQSGARGLIEAP
jgi:hypothetical protein